MLHLIYTCSSTIFLTQYNDSGKLLTHTAGHINPNIDHEPANPIAVAACLLYHGQ